MTTLTLALSSHRAPRRGTTSCNILHTRRWWLTAPMLSRALHCTTNVAVRLATSIPQCGLARCQAAKLMHATHTQGASMLRQLSWCVCEQQGPPPRACRGVRLVKGDAKACQAEANACRCAVPAPLRTKQAAPGKPHAVVWKVWRVWGVHTS